MLTRELSGISFEIASPSHYRLANINAGHTIDIGYLGGVEDWYLCHEAPDGSVKLVRCPSRDAAIKHIGEALSRCTS